jgi:hypothetical protein
VSGERVYAFSVSGPLALDARFKKKYPAHLPPLKLGQALTFPVWVGPLLLNVLTPGDMGTRNFVGSPARLSRGPARCFPFRRSSRETSVCPNYLVKVESYITKDAVEKVICLEIYWLGCTTVAWQ